MLAAAAALQIPAQRPCRPPRHGVRLRPCRTGRHPVETPLCCRFSRRSTAAAMGSGRCPGSRPSWSATVSASCFAGQLTTTAAPAPDTARRRRGESAAALTLMCARRIGCSSLTPALEARQSSVAEAGAFPGLLPEPRAGAAAPPVLAGSALVVIHCPCSQQSRVDETKLERSAAHPGRRPDGRRRWPRRGLETAALRMTTDGSDCVAEDAAVRVGALPGRYRPAA